MCRGASPGEPRHAQGSRATPGLARSCRAVPCRAAPYPDAPFHVESWLAGGKPRRAQACRTVPGIAAPSRAGPRREVTSLAVCGGALKCHAMCCQVLPRRAQPGRAEGCRAAPRRAVPRPAWPGPVLTRLEQRRTSSERLLQRARDLLQLHDRPSDPSIEVSNGSLRPNLVSAPSPDDVRSDRDASCHCGETLVRSHEAASTVALKRP